MPRLTYGNQINIFNPYQWSHVVHLVGLGNVGSTLVLKLAKLGIAELHLWDDDYVELGNIATQELYRKRDIGKRKVDAVREILLEDYELDITVVVHYERVTSKTQLEGVVFSGVDRMAERHEVWGAVYLNTEVPLYFDGRVGGENAQLLTIRPSNFDDIEYYKTVWLFSDDEADDLACGAESILHPAVQVAAWACQNLTLFARGEGFERNRIVNLGVKSK